MKYFYAGERIRTPEGTKPMRLERIPFDHSGTPASHLVNNKPYKKLYKALILQSYNNLRV